MNNLKPTTFRASVALVLEETKNSKELYRSAHTNLLRFAIDTCLVAHGIRTGYLVDAVYPSDPTLTLTALLMALRQKSSVFEHVVFWHHAPTMQSFLVHVPLLQQKLAGLLAGAGVCVFVKLDKCLSVSREPPDRLREALRDVRCLMAGSPHAPLLSLSETLTEETLVPLSAIVIDYPVAYVPTSSTQTSFLEGEALDVYTTSFKGMTSDSTLGLGKQHVFLMFSCPRAIVGNHAELSPATMIEKLQAKFTVGLGRIGARPSVTHRTEILDRVAL